MAAPTNITSQASAEMISPEMARFYGDRPLMWRNLGLIVFLSVGWSLSFTVLGPLMQLRLNKMGVSLETLGLMSGINGWLYSYAVMYFAWKSDHTVSASAGAFLTCSCPRRSSSSQWVCSHLSPVPGC